MSVTITTASIITLIRGLIDDMLKTDGVSAFEYDSDNSFKLNSDNVVSSSIIVYQNGTEISEDDWAYNSDTNKVTVTFVTSGESLTKGDNIVITFNHYERFSDTELTAYIKANLVEFSRRNYKKTFYMNSSNEVVALNDANPTLKEGNLIAIVTAIKIDPKNIKINTRDWSISAEEYKSVSEQLDDVFRHFNFTLGDIDFLEKEI